MKSIANRIKKEAEKEHRYELGIGGRAQTRLLEKWKEMRPEMLKYLKKQGVEKLLAKILEERAMEELGEKMRRDQGNDSDNLLEAMKIWYLIRPEERPVTVELDSLLNRAEKMGMVQ